MCPRLFGLSPSARCTSTALLLLAFTAPASAEDVEIGDTRTTYLDPEFWASTRQVVWQDGENFDIWLADIDPDSGELIPRDGRGTLVRSGSGAGGDVAPPWPSGFGLGSFNGPEFGRNAQGLFTYFTVLDGQSVPQVGRFGPLDGGTPTYQRLTTGDHVRRGALPTLSADFDPGATLTIDDDLQPSWRYDDEPNTDRPVPLDGFPLRGPRWIPGEKAVSTLVRDAGVLQAAAYDVETESLRRLTDDAGNKSEPLIFDSPELGGRALMCKVGDRELAIYEESTPFWTKVWSVQAPFWFPGGGQSASIYYPGAFVFEGKTYVYFVVGRIFGVTPLGPSRIYAARLNGQPFQVSASTWRWRWDPEVVVIDDEAFLYYYVFTGFFPRRAAIVNTNLHVVRDFVP